MSVWEFLVNVVMATVYALIIGWTGEEEMAMYFLLMLIALNQVGIGRKLGKINCDESE